MATPRARRTRTIGHIRGRGGHTHLPRLYQQSRPGGFFSSTSGNGSISTFQGALNPPEQSKPLWMGEGSFGNSLDSSDWWQDAYAQGGYPAKYFAALWSNTMPTCSGQNCTPCSWQSGQVCQQAFW